MLREGADGYLCVHNLIPASSPSPETEGRRLRAFHIAGFEGIKLKPGCPDQVVHLTIEVTAHTDPFPIRRQTMMPASNTNFRDRPCPTKSNRPPGLRTRHISINAAIRFGIEHNVQVMTTASKAASPRPGLNPKG